jgi:hypothetical protein
MEIEPLLEQRADVKKRHEGSGRIALAVASHYGNNNIIVLPVVSSAVFVSVYPSLIAV